MQNIKLYFNRFSTLNMLSFGNKFESIDKFDYFSVNTLSFHNFDEFLGLFKD
jgi:hypothetical protein